MSSALYIGLMTGTSLDGVDAVLATFPENGQPAIHACHSRPFSADLKARILQLCQPSTNEIEKLGALDHEIGIFLAQASNELIKSAGVPKSAICAIGSHGQTIRHRPPSASRPTHQSFSLQIGDPNTIAHLTGIDTVADFRRRAIAAGSQGAPLVPAFHHAAFRNPEGTRVIVNIGGMANITVVKPDKLGPCLDTGPGNVLMDSWISLSRNLPFDQDGAWAASARHDPSLLATLLENPYFSAPLPKSTGREDFNLEQLQLILERHPALQAETVQATLMMLTATSIANAITTYAPGAREVFLCGGGAFNKALHKSIRDILPGKAVRDTSALGIPPQWVESCAFAWLAKKRINNEPVLLPDSDTPLILGTVAHH